jgi:hypothetical protein
MQTGIDKSMLRRYIKNIKASHTGTVTQVGYWSNRCVFTSDEEMQLSDYLQQSCRMYFGLTPREVRTLAFEFALKLDKQMPITWREHSEAGLDWFQGFMARHREISLRIPESTSIARATSFNETNVAQFFSPLTEVKERHHFQSKDIYNVDDSGCMTVQKASKAVAPTGSKQVGTLTSCERGQLVTICCAVNAIGQAIPPMLVFPRVHFKEYFIRDGPPGCAGTAYPSGWMTSDGFLLFMKHFVQQVGFRIH